jgi:pyruvate dehydrogenase E1 component alpha subunit
MPSCIVDGNDVRAVYEAAGEAITRARSGEGPTLLETKTYRIRGHYEGDPQNYRSREEVDEWRELCPIHRFRTLLVDEGVPETELESIDAGIEDELEAATAFAETSPLPDLQDVYFGIYTEETEVV